jgi:hypothetical protein
MTWLPPFFVTYASLFFFFGKQKRFIPNPSAKALLGGVCTPRGAFAF